MIRRHLRMALAQPLALAADVTYIVGDLLTYVVRRIR